MACGLVSDFDVGCCQCRILLVLDVVSVGFCWCWMLIHEVEGLLLFFRCAISNSLMMLLR